MRDLVRPESLELCERMLDFAALRHKVLANNVANVNTPGFKRSDVEFAQELDRVLRDKGLEGVKDVKLRISKPDETAFRNDGNNVSIDKEMAAMSENALLYQIYAQLIARRFRQLNEILKGA
jgi:flagellar basal-body rod protein FlgB